MRRNIVANFIGRFWSLLSNFLFIPLYIKYLGFESYSIISFTMIVAGVMAILDAGLTATLSREFSRKNVTIDEKGKTFRALESIYVIISILIIVGVYFSAHYVAQNYVNSSTYNVDRVAYFLKILSFDIGFQMLCRFYLGGLFGLEKQIQANAVQTGWGVFRNGLVVVVLMFMPTLEVFFAWQAFITILSVFITRKILVSQFAKAFSFRFSFDKLVYQNIWRFTSGMLLISAVAGINTQVDKIMVSKLLSVESLGYYTIAVSLSMGLLTLVSPFSTALLPRFTAMYSIGERENASQLFIKYYNMIAIIVFSIMANMIFFPNAIIWVWTGNINVATHSARFLSVIAISYAMLAVVNVYYNIAIANGYTKLNNVLGVGSLLLTIPGYWYAVKLYGGIGAACVFLAIQCIVTVIYIYIINKKFLVNISIWKMYFNKLLFPLSLALVIAWLFSFIWTTTYQSRALTLLYVGFSTVITFSVTLLLLTPKIEIRKILSFRI